MQKPRPAPNLPPHFQAARQMMDIQPCDIPDVKILRPKKHGDHRGFFSETYNRRAMEEAGIDLDFVQDNQSLSAE